ncbi:MAG: hypothetical protein ACREU8_06745 [Gammaproteobacteria bacterium]
MALNPDSISSETQLHAAPLSQLGEDSGRLRAGAAQLVRKLCV